MKIFNAEIKAGIADKIQNNSIAFCSEVIPYTPTEIDINSCRSIKAIAENKNQMDLYYIKSILASVGWNKNDDVFDAAETWKAKSTPEDKQFNYMHDEKDIIGHITSCYAADAEGNILPDFNDMSQVPSVFDIVIGSVLYTSWSSSELKNRMKEIIADVESGQTWHVSMECLFPQFDYALIDNSGASKIVKREESSAFLTKHLRAYGGKGEYNGYKVGRLLRSFSFSGVGLVKKPANPRSVILNHQKTINFNVSKSEEIIMQDDLEILKAELAEAKEAKDKMKEEAAKMKEEAKKAKSEVEATVADLQSQLSQATEALAAEKGAKEKMAEEMKKMKEKAEMNQEELDKMKKEKQMSKRKAELSEAGLNADEVNETSAQFESLADDMFDSVVAALKKAKMAAKSKEAPTEKKEDEKPTDKAKKKPAFAAEEVDVNEAEAEVLDTAVATENQIPMVDVAEEESLRSFASTWFSEKVLKSTANIK
jgi:chemotaxis protein histidine kinase CheA